jgi:prepilin signal peptidase PulO-like enzyme (type II secretory pathway)
MILPLIFPLLLGWLAGYLVNYLADGLPADLRLAPPRCKNPDCAVQIRWADYFLLRRCRVCTIRRSPRVTLVMLVTTIMTAYMWLSPPKNMGFWLGFIVFIYLFLVALIDFETRLVLRPVSLVGLVVCLSAGLVMRTWQETLLGAAAGFGIMFLLYILGILFSRWRNKRLGNVQDGEEALGSGDVTLATLLGLLLGWPQIWFNLLTGILLAGVFSILLIIALLVSRKYRPLMVFIPFGPFFILMAFFFLYFPRFSSAFLLSG